MVPTLKKPMERMGYDFIPPAYLPEGKDEFYLRDQQFSAGADFRALTAYEIEILVKNENQADDWTDIRVADQFNPHLVKNCQFYGRIRIGALGRYFLEYHELKLPVGLYNSTIVSCDIGDHVVIKNVNYLAHYIIGNEVILFNIDEMHTTNHSKFGNGILKEGEAEDVRVWLEVSNENGGRRILPFEGMLPADAWLWAKYRADKVLMERLREMTEARFDSRRGYYGTIGDRCIIKNTRILKDVKVGSDAYIKGGNKLKNLTINSSAEAPSQIGEGVELVNGIMGYGSRAFYGVKAVRFLMGENTTLKYGARLINSFLGDNSTISCCEVLNSMLFPAHEQHHNNSFLVAATVMGQSNIAAAATIGSNHNSRGADGELVAGRGFWPGLATSLKHNSRFASFCILAKGDYPLEIDLPLPFALVSNNESENCLQILPAYWWLYNMYALSRNAWKYEARDRRHHRLQPIVFDFLAPDTVAELFEGMRLLERYATAAYLREAPSGNGDGQHLGRSLLTENTEVAEGLSVLADGIENGGREVRVFKIVKAYQAYREMIHYYAVKALMEYGLRKEVGDWKSLAGLLAGSGRSTWVNLGGQLMPETELEALKEDLCRRKISSWDALHDRYNQIHERYTAHNAAYAFASLLELHGLTASAVDEDRWRGWMEEALDIARTVARRTLESRQKDYRNHFRQITFDTEGEMEAVMGRLDDNDFIRRMETEARHFAEQRQRWVKA